MFQVTELKRTEENDAYMDTIEPMRLESIVETSIPVNFVLIVGKDNDRNIIRTNKEILACLAKVSSFLVKGTGVKSDSSWQYTHYFFSFVNKTTSEQYQKLGVIIYTQGKTKIPTAKLV